MENLNSKINLRKNPSEVSFLKRLFSKKDNNINLLDLDDKNLLINEDNKKVPFVKQRTNTIKTIACGTTFKGEIFCDEDIVINGDVDGNIFSYGDVIVGNKSVVKGDIRANNLIVKGNVKGNVNAQGYIHINQNACQMGKIHSNEIIVDQSANIVGSINVTMDSIDMTVFNNI